MQFFSFCVKDQRSQWSLKATQFTATSKFDANFVHAYKTNAICLQSLCNKDLMGGRLNFTFEIL